MTSAEYLAKRIARIRAEIDATNKNSVRALGESHPSADAISAELNGAALRLENAVLILNLVARATGAGVSVGVSEPVRFEFIAVGKDDGRDIYAQDETGGVWAGAAFGGIKNAFRFPTRIEAEKIAQKRGGYAYPIPV